MEALNSAVKNGENLKSFPVVVRNRANGFTLRRLSGSLERRVQKSLQRFSPMIAKARLVLEDENGPKGGYDKRISVQLSLVNGRFIAMEGQGTLFARALTYTLDRLIGSLRKINGKKQARRRQALDLA